MNTDRTSEAAGVAALKAGDEAAFDAMVARHQRPLFTFACRYLHNGADAEDLVIETFVRLYQARHRLRPDTNLAAWLFTTLANLCHNRHRWRMRHPEVSLDLPPAPGEPTAGPFTAEAPVEDEDTQGALRAAIDRLPHDQRTAVLLHHYEQLSYREIAAIVDCSERGVETRLYRARQQLREELAPYFRQELAS